MLMILKISFLARSLFTKLKNEMTNSEYKTSPVKCHLLECHFSEISHYYL